MLLVLLQSMSLCKTPKIFPQVQVLRHPFANLDFGFRGLRSCSQTAQVPTHYVRAGSVADGPWYVLYWRLRDTVALTLGISAQMRATSTPCPTLLLFIAKSQLGTRRCRCRRSIVLPNTEQRLRNLG